MKTTITALVAAAFLMSGVAHAEDAMKKDEMAKDAPAAMSHDNMKKPMGAMKKDHMAKDGMKKDAMAKDGMKKDAMAKDGMKKDAMDKDEMKK